VIPLDWESTAFFDYLDSFNWDSEIGDEITVTDDDSRVEFVKTFSGCTSYRATLRTPRYQTIVHQPLYRGCQKTLKDLSLCILSLRHRFGSHIGDQIQGSIFGLVATFLPRDNLLRHVLPLNPSAYSLNETVLEGGLSQQTLRSYMVPICQRGCTAFCGPAENLLQCASCKTPKFKECLATCYSEEREKLCDHKVGKFKRQLYYNSISHRISVLLNSDLRNFFSYPTLRPTSEEGMLHDVYDGLTWKWFEENKPRGSLFIGIQVSWDGAQMHDRRNTKSMWPLMWSILNFPPELRDKPFLGLHLASLDTGSEASLEVLVNELLILWNTGITINGQHYVVGLCHIICDGRGREKIKKVQGSGSLIGCHICDFPGRSFASRIVYPNWQR
jgi:hypothetical protein